MTFLLLSVQYPSKVTRAKFMEDSGPIHQGSSPLHKPLAGSASDDQWKHVLRLLRQQLDASVFSASLDGKRPLRPNDDNYEMFMGEEWQPEDDVVIPPAMAAMMGQGLSAMPTPHFDRCANCTKMASLQCSKCKFVKYCSRDCQARHWKKIHKESCVKAVEGCSIERALQNNDGFWVSPDECRTLSVTLQDAKVEDLDELPPAKLKMAGAFHFFSTYFTYAADLGGCFVL